MNRKDPVILIVVLVYFICCLMVSGNGRIPFEIFIFAIPPTVILLCVAAMIYDANFNPYTDSKRFSHYHNINVRNREKYFAERKAAREAAMKSDTLNERH